MTNRIRALALFSLMLVASVALVAGTGASPKPKDGRADHGSHGNQSHRGSKVKQPPASFFGIDPQDALSDGDYARMASSGVKVLRTGLYWQSVQPVEGAFNFDGFDALVRAAALHRIRTLPYLYGTPDWVARDLDGRDCPPECFKYGVQSTAALSAWKQFAAASAQRYGPNGTFWAENPDVPKEAIRDWQIWNEQNSNKFYLPKPDPNKFAKVLAAASKGLRSVDSKAEVVLGGMFGLPGRGEGQAIAAATFIHKLLKVKGAKNTFDGIALHPYSKLLKSIQEQAEVSRKELRKSGYSSADLWITETGAASGGEPDPLNLGSKKAQAQRLTDTYKLFAKHRKDWKVKLVAWFAWQDSHASDTFCSFCAESGLIDQNGAAKPSLGAYKRVAK